MNARPTATVAVHGMPPLTTVNTTGLRLLAELAHAETRARDVQAEHVLEEIGAQTGADATDWVAPIWDAGYSTAVRDALRWLAGDTPSEQLAELLELPTTTPEV